ncbi:MAG: 16S rRNA (cytidine(1402)-2'-O)-methyltransferase [Deltaproteobacteria bacterium]|nr:16S rRNA (cytidine(1402)-2'-O)-methyltransferase [Deltaproteobacteria bacterium]
MGQRPSPHDDPLAFPGVPGPVAPTPRAAQRGRLTLVATPIGNLQDLTLRALAVLREADAIACEDTRRTLKVLAHYGIPRPGAFFSCHEHNERAVVGRVLGLLGRDLAVALCTDAGTPLLSDPGYLVAREARSAGFPVEVVPGPSAVTAALLASGLPAHAFTFRGFPPRKPGPRRRMLAAQAGSDTTLVLFEAPGRLGSLLADAAVAFGPEREAAVCVELTKRFEAVDRAPLGELAARYADGGVRGEVTVVIAGIGREQAREERRSGRRQEA